MQLFLRRPVLQFFLRPPVLQLLLRRPVRQPICLVRASHSARRFGLGALEERAEGRGSGTRSRRRRPDAIIFATTRSAVIFETTRSAIIFCCLGLPIMFGRSGEWGDVQGGDDPMQLFLRRPVLQLFLRPPVLQLFLRRPVPQSCLLGSSFLECQAPVLLLLLFGLSFL